MDKMLAIFTKNVKFCNKWRSNFGIRCPADGQDVGTVGETIPEPRRLDDTGW